MPQKTTALRISQILLFMNVMVLRAGNLLKKHWIIFLKIFLQSPTPSAGILGTPLNIYADTFFKYLNADAVTVAPYMGEDSVTPFLEHRNKWVILLALTSNKGALDFQFLTDSGNEELYKKVIKKSLEWGSETNMMYVVGATRAEMIGKIRGLAPSNFFLVPGVGAQGGSLEDVANYGWNEDCGIIVNSSRDIIYASQNIDFGDKAGEKAQNLQLQMAEILKNKGF